MISFIRRVLNGASVWKLVRILLNLMETAETRFPDGDSKKKYVTEQAYAAFNINPKLGGTNATNVILALKTAIDAVKALINALKALRGGVR